MNQLNTTKAQADLVSEALRRIVIVLLTHMVSIWNDYFKKTF